MLFNENSRFKPYGHVLRPFAHCLPTSRHILAKMTGGLNVLYQQMRKSKRPTPADFNLCTDKNGNFHPTEDMPLLAGRYKFTQVIGVGQSSIVLKAKDTFQDGRAVAVKVLKVKYSILGAQEAGCLINLNSSDPHRFAPILQLLNTFRLGQHYCMVFELLHPTSLIKLFAEKPTAQEKLRCIRKVAFRLLSAVGFLQSRKIIHADLKPDNLLLSREKKLNSLKIVDFGNAFHCVHDELSLYYDDFELQTLVYRAPEVFFGMMFGVEVDMWSIGCILAELYTGTPLFYGPNLESILMKMHTLLGPIPQEIFQRGKFYRKLEKFTKCNVKPLDVTSVMQCLNCSDFLFTDFLVRLLKYDPASRMTVTDAAEHPFLASELGIKYFNLRKVYNTVPSYPKIFLTEDVNRYSPREVNRGSSLVEETSSLQLETSKFPDILKITLTEKIIKNDDLSDYKRRSISSELKSGSCSSEVNAKPKSSGKLKAIRALSSSSSKIESNEADNSSNMPTRLVPASEKNGQVTVERMEPERRTRVQRSDDVIFSQMGKQERNCDEGLSNFHTCEEHRSILSCSEANIIQRPTKTTSPSTEELRVSSDDERKRPRSAQDSASAVDVSDHRDRNTQKQNLRELKSLLSKILASPPLHSSTSNGDDDDDDDDKNQHLRNGSKTDLNTTFVKPSLAHNLISEEELPGVCDGDSMNPSILPSKKIVVDMNFASDGSKEVARSLKPNSATLGKASSVTGHSNNNLLSGFFKVQSNIPDLPETTGQICNSLSERKTELSARRSDNHTGEKTTREDELCTLSQKMSPSHLEEKVPDENHLKLHRSSVVTGSKCLKSSDQRSIPNAGGNWSLTPKSIPVVAGYNTPHKKQCHEKSSLDTTFVVERRSNGRPSFATPVAISDTRRQPSKTMKATAKSPSCVEPPVKPVFSSDENKTSSKPEINVKRNSGGEESNGDQQLCCGDGFGKAFEKFQDLEMGFANHEPRKLEKRSRNQTSPLVTENDFPPKKRLKVNSDQNSSGLHKPSVRSIFTSPRDVSVSSESKGSDNSHGKWKVSPDRNSDGRQNCRSGRRGRDLNETFMVLKNQVQNKPGRNLSGHLSSSSSTRDSRALERPPKRRFDDLRVEDFEEVGSEFVRRRRNLSNHVVASDEESVESDDSTKSGYTLDASSAKRSRLALSISTESCLHHSEDGNDDALIALTP